MITVHGMSRSGNCHKLRLLLDYLGRPYRWNEIDILKGESRTPAFLAMNPAGRVPLLEESPGRYLPESNAILCYLAEGTRYLPAAAWERAQALGWLFFEQYSHEPYVAVARFIRVFLPPDHPRQAELPRLLERGGEALAVMERQLAAQHYLVGASCTVADIALYAYTHVAAEGGFDLAPYPAVRAWLSRMEQEPGHSRMA